MQGRYGYALGEIEKRQAPFKVVAHLLALISRQSVPLVCNNNQRAAALHYQAQQADVLFGYAFLGIEHGNHDLCTFYGLQCLDDAEFLDRFVHTGLATYSRRIDKQVLAIVALERNRDTVTRRTRLVEYDHPLLAKQAVCQRRFTNVGTTDNGDSQLPVVFVFGVFCRLCYFEAAEDVIHHRANTVSVCGRHRNGIAQTQTMEIAVGDRGIQPFGLVNRQARLLGVFSREFGDMLVCRREAATTVDHNDGDVRFPQSNHSLLDHDLCYALFPTRQTACVDNEIGNWAQLAETVYAVSGQAGKVRDQGVA